MRSNEPELSHSVTMLIDMVKSRDFDAAEQLWNRYFQQLLPLARAKLKSAQGQIVDEEDILISVFDRFFSAAGDGKFAKLTDRDDLWQILLMLTERKIIDQHRRATANKRGSGEVVRDSELDADLSRMRELVDKTPGPELIAEFNENLRVVLLRLKDQKTREVAICKLEGRTNQEIGERLNVSLSSVERKLRVIREVWQSES